MEKLSTEESPTVYDDDLLCTPSASEVERCLLTPEAASDEGHPARLKSDRTPSDQSRAHKLSGSPETPTSLGRPPFAKQFSVHSRRRSFMVTDYGPESIDKSLESVLSGRRGPSVSECPEESSTESGVQVTQSTSCVLVDMSAAMDSVDYDPERRRPKMYPQEQTCLNFTGTIPSVVKPKNRKQLIAFEIAKRGRLFAKRKKDRLVEKDGECRIIFTKVSNRSSRLLHDFFTTMLELKWRYHFLLFAAAFAVSWVAFALIWWGLAVYDANRNRKAANDSLVPDFEPCVTGVSDYTSALLFSIETQQTIGYGTRAVTTSCPLAITVVMVQSICGVIIQCILTGIIFAKLARPKRRAETIIFSKKAVICERDGVRTLMFRIGDIRRSHVLATSVHVMLTERRTTKEGESLPIATRELKVTTESGSEFFFLAWPIEVLHRIDSTSPLWDLTESDLIQKDWEFIVVMEGVAEVTGASFQVRTSYLPSEVLWGHRLKSLLNKNSGGFLEIDYTHFHEIEPILMTEKSAREAAKRHEQEQEDEQRHKRKVEIQSENNNESLKFEGCKQEMTYVPKIQ